MQEGYIGVFDSGAGGLSVLRECIKGLNKERFLYYADSKNAPYGSLDSDRILALTQMNIQSMEGFGLKALVLACNTATSVAVSELRQSRSYPVIGAEPALKPACKKYIGGNILVLATPATLSRAKFLELANIYARDCNIIAKPLPHLAELIEKYLIHKSASEKEIREYLGESLKDIQEKNIQATVLGCTHYPLIRELIMENLPKNTEIFDSAEGIATTLKRRIQDIYQSTEARLEQECHNVFNAKHEKRLEQERHNVFNAEHEERREQECHNVFNAKHEKRREQECHKTFVAEHEKKDAEIRYFSTLTGLEKEYERCFQRLIESH